MLKPVPTSAEATLSFAEFKPLPPVKPRREDETVSLVETPASVHVSPSKESAAAKGVEQAKPVSPAPRASAPMLATGLPSPAKRATQTLFGLPAPVLAKSALVATPSVMQPSAEAQEPAPPLATQIVDEVPTEVEASGQTVGPSLDALASEAAPLLQLSAEDERANSRPPSALKRSWSWLHLAWTVPVALGCAFVWTRMSPASGSRDATDSARSPLAQAPTAAEARALALGSAAPAEPAAPAARAVAEGPAEGAEGTDPAAAQDDPAGLLAEPVRAAEEPANGDAPAAQAAEADALGSTAHEGEEAEVEEVDDSRKAAAARADKLIDEAHALRKKRKLGPARVKYRAALAAYPGYPRATAGLLQLALQTRDGKQAVNLAKQLVQQRPNQLSYQVLLGDAYKVAGKRSLARETWQAAARKGSATARARLAK